MENTPTLETPRLVLRRFTSADIDAFWRLMRDAEVNAYLPWFPLETRQEAEAFLHERYLITYVRPRGFRYAICLKKNNAPVGYVNLGDGDSHDFGYALARQHWGHGIATEAARAVVEQLKRAGTSFITATHDVNNPASGKVMRNIGMAYRYTYEEHWQPKDRLVTFRMYQLNLDGRDERVYMGYWQQYPVHFIEKNV